MSTSERSHGDTVRVFLDGVDVTDKIVSAVKGDNGEVELRRPSGMKRLYRKGKVEVVRIPKRRCK